MSVHFNQGHFEILVIQKPKLLFLIRILNTRRFYYYVLFTVEQLNLNPENFY
jgi:hypothetical protein